MVEFVVNLEIISASGWETVEYFDCCHGYCHLHTVSDESTPLAVHRLDEVHDVQTAFGEVTELVTERMRIIRG